MSAQTLNRNEQAAALTALGYSVAEASFLTIAALHGGQFLRRQVAQFLRTKDGGRVTQLVQRALSLEHVQCSIWRQNVHLYHLSARPLYTALGEPDNRNRRRHEWTEIKNRVMRLDFVLAHPGAQFLATEGEKVAYFAGLGIDTGRLPVKLFRSGSDATSTARYFVDKYPIRIATSPGGNEDHVQLCFVDEGSVGLSRFENHLVLYRPLFAALPSFELIYVAGSSMHFARATATFDRFLKHGDKPDAAAETLPVDQLLTYFRLRKRYEQREFNAFDRSELLRLRDARERFADTKHEALFRLWLSAGDSVATPIDTSKGTDSTCLRGTFGTELLRHDYSFFGGYGLR